MQIDWYQVFESLEMAENQMNIGSIKAIRAGGVLVCLVRTQEGFFAIQDFCPHNKALFSKGILNKWNEIVCPWHGYRFQVKTGKKAEAYACPDAQTFPVRIDEKGLCVGIVAKKT